MGLLRLLGVRGVSAGLVSTLCAMAFAAGVADARAAQPGGDLLERFFSDPRAGAPWFANGSWRWEALGTSIVSSGADTATLLSTARSRFTGTLSVKLKLVKGRDNAPAKARLIFAFNPATGAHRWLEIASGNPGRLVLGQTGTIRGSAEGAIQVFRAPVPQGEWLQVSLLIGENKEVAVSLGSRQLFTASAAPLAPGLVGVSSRRSDVVFDEVAFTSRPTDPNLEPCRECHAGQADQPQAANVFTYWDGRWWDRNRGGSSGVQQGGHGDRGGKAPLNCVGAADLNGNGCHDLRLPSPGEHRDGARGGRGHRTANTFHLRAEFIAGSVANPWDVQIVFDDFCSTACHVAAWVPFMSHTRDASPAPNAVELGQHGSLGDGESLPVLVDSDLTTKAATAAPDYAPCISCHDPHGTGTIATDGISNNMVRSSWSNPATLCQGCH